MFKTLIAAAVAIGMASSVQAHSLVIENHSAWAIVTVKMTPHSDQNWGRDHLGDDVMNPGDRLTIYNIDTGRWDIKFVDEDLDECVVPNFSVTRDMSWALTDSILLACEFHR
jgi:hypothetical protein